MNAPGSVSGNAGRVYTYSGSKGLAKSLGQSGRSQEAACYNTDGVKISCPKKEGEGPLSKVANFLKRVIDIWSK